MQARGLPQDSLDLWAKPCVDKPEPNDPWLPHARYYRSWRQKQANALISKIAVYFASSGMSKICAIGCNHLHLLQKVITYRKLKSTLLYKFHHHLAAVDACKHRSKHATWWMNYLRTYVRGFVRAVPHFLVSSYFWALTIMLCYVHNAPIR